jgi:DNA replication protein DnaC
MRTLERWNTTIRQKVMEQVFSPRLLEDLKKIHLPEVDNVVSTYIHGEANTGKTVLAAHLLMEKEKQMYLEGVGGRCVFLYASNLYHELKLAFTTGENVIDKYRTNPNLLVLDDIGVSKLSEWSAQEFMLLLNHRYEYMLPTIFTCNLSLIQLNDYFGDARIPSRIERMCKIIKKKDWRNNKT